MGVIVVVVVVVVVVAASSCGGGCGSVVNLSEFKRETILLYSC